MAEEEVLTRLFFTSIVYDESNSKTISCSKINRPGTPKKMLSGGTLFISFPHGRSF